ncbi:hypothetical protein D9M68_882930 [compost metagenome]
MATLNTRKREVSSGEDAGLVPKVRGGAISAADSVTVWVHSVMWQHFIATYSAWTKASASDGGRSVQCTGRHGADRHGLAEPVQVQ